ncbi:hypothetical protein BDV25DRAFT_153257 [Aspergillus avenaceus]|uniref:Uncharacterized protein n=1 Tax=Aspergillus avenaceus TaxID=36643 RepID=A0A5N6TXT4_ASPAV|nr:hypothetical protein BDV25DRAFT_153257 [Aspergillus avenaceus]
MRKIKSCTLFPLVNNCSATLSSFFSSRFLFVIVLAFFENTRHVRCLLLLSPQFF